MSKSIVKGIKGRKQLYHAVYDFDKDGGAAGAIDLFTFKANTLIHDFYYEVETAMTSAGSATVEVGVTADTDGYITQVAFDGVAIDHVSSTDEKGALLYDSTDDHDIRIKVTAETIAQFKITTAALTAGKIHFYAECSDGY